MKPLKTEPTWDATAQKWNENAKQASLNGWPETAIECLNAAFLCEHEAEMEARAENAAKDHERREASEQDLINQAREAGRY